MAADTEQDARVTRVNAARQDWRQGDFALGAHFFVLRTDVRRAYRSTRDIRLVRRIARHKSIDTTTIYAAVADEDLLQATRHLPC